VRGWMEEKHIITNYVGYFILFGFVKTD
jgi:hypothetical protein